MTESKTWQYRFDVDITTFPAHEQGPHNHIVNAIDAGSRSKKMLYPCTFFAWSYETKGESGKPHIHIAIEYKDAHTDNVRKGITDRMRQFLGIDKGNKAEYASGLWKEHHYYLGYMSKENLAHHHGFPHTFENKTNVECLRIYKDKKEKNKNVFKIKNKELLDQVVDNIKNDKDYSMNKKMDDYRHLAIDHYMAESKRRKYTVNYHQAKSDIQKVIFKLSHDNRKIELYLINKLFMDC